LQLKIDIHVHTYYSKDSIITLDDLISQIKKNRLDGIAITDHDTVEGAIKIVRAIKEKGIGINPIIIPGIEVSTKRGHILGINMTTPIPKKLSIEETVERIHENGGIAIAAHPETFFKDGIGLNPKILSAGLDAIEVINSSVFPFKLLTQLCKKFAERYGLPQTAGSDSHIPETIGLSYTLMECDSAKIDDIIESIRKGLTKPVGRGIPMTLRIKRVFRKT